MKPRLRPAVFLFILAIILFAATAAAGDETIESYTLEGGAADGLSFLSGYANLRDLTLVDCPATDLSPLVSCKKLVSLTICWSDGYQSGGAYDLSPLKDCARLRSLTLEGACMTDLTPLKALKKLTYLSVKSLGALDYTPIAGRALKHLMIYGAPGEQVAEIFAAIGGKLTSAVIGDCTLTPEANDAIFGGSRLMSLRFECVGGIETDVAKWRTLSKLTTLSISGSSLSDLAFLSDYVSTVIVRLDDIIVGGAVCSVRFDKYFLITDNVPSHAMLRILDGSGYRWLYATVGMKTGSVSKEVIAAFARIDSLQSLDVQAVASDAWTSYVWTGFAQLEQLKLSDCGTADMGLLQQLGSLQRLTVKRTDIVQAGDIGKLYRLKQLSLLSCTIDDWTFLSDLSELELLSLADCGGPDTVSFTADMPKLAVLVLEDTPISDLSLLTGKKLTFLSLYGCPVADYTPLQGLPSLSTLACNEDAALPPFNCHVMFRRYINIQE